MKNSSPFFYARGADQSGSPFRGASTKFYMASLELSPYPCMPRPFLQPESLIRKQIFTSCFVHIEQVQV